MVCGLSVALDQIEGCVANDGLCVRDARDAFGEKGFGLLLAVLALPSALPLPAAGYSVPFGVLLIALGLQLMSGRARPWLPQRCLKWRLPARRLPPLLAGARRVARWVERFIRPRMAWVLRGPARWWMGGLVVFMGLLMCIPIPTTNTAPAMVIFLIGIALTEEDGLFGLLAIAGGTLAAALYAGVLYLFYVFFFVEGGSLSGFRDYLLDLLPRL